jgi:fibronectin type 3 domain-containing protein
VTTHVGGGSGEVLVTWTQNSESDVVSYIVYRALSAGGSPTRIGTASRHDVTLFPDLPFVDTTATVGYYRVRAVDSAGQRGPISAEVCGAAPGHGC